MPSSLTKCCPTSRQVVGTLSVGAALYYLYDTYVVGKKVVSLAVLEASDDSTTNGIIAAFKNDATFVALAQAETSASTYVLGMKQQAWLADGLKRSASAGKPWQVLVQQVLMGNLVTAPRLTEGLPADLPAYIRQRILAGAMAGRAELPLNMDAWDGYPAARERVFKAALDANANLISLAGDTHNAWAFDLDHAGEKVGVEFGVQGVTSPGLESYASYLPVDVLEREMVAHNRQLKWMDGSRRGYMAVELTPASASSEFRFVSSVREKGAGVNDTRRVSTQAGSRALDIG